MSNGVLIDLDDARKLHPLEIKVIKKQLVIDVEKFREGREVIVDQLKCIEKAIKISSATQEILDQVLLEKAGS